MSAAPRIPFKCGPGDAGGFGLDSEHDAILVCEWSAKDDEACLHQAIHERRVLVPSGLVLQRLRRIPIWA